MLLHASQNPHLQKNVALILSKYQYLSCYGHKNGCGTLHMLFPSIRTTLAQVNFGFPSDFSKEVHKNNLPFLFDSIVLCLFPNQIRTVFLYRQVTAVFLSSPLPPPPLIF